MSINEAVGSINRDVGFGGSGELGIDILNRTFPGLYFCCTSITLLRGEFLLLVILKLVLNLGRHLPPFLQSPLFLSLSAISLSHPFTSTAKHVSIIMAPPSSLDNPAPAPPPPSPASQDSDTVLSFSNP